MSLRVLFEIEFKSTLRSLPSLAVIVILPSLVSMLSYALGTLEEMVDYLSLFAYQLTFFTYPGLMLNLVRGRWRIEYLLYSFRGLALVPIVSALSALPWMVSSYTFLATSSIFLRGSHKWISLEAMLLFVVAGLFSSSVAILAYYASSFRSSRLSFLAVYQALLLVVSLSRGEGSSMALIASYAHPISSWMGAMLNEPRLTLFDVAFISTTAYLLALSLLFLLLTSRRLLIYLPAGDS